MIRFIDGNYPGVVYSGTEAHMEGLAREGGCPIKLKGTDPLWDVEDGIRYDWEEKPAPAFWAEPSENPEGESPWEDSYWGPSD